MAFAIQYITRPGIGHGGYVVNDGTNTVFIPCTTPSDRTKLFEWLGNGDKAMGRDIHRDNALSMPDVSLNPAQYNAMVCDMHVYSVMPYVKEV